MQLLNRFENLYKNLSLESIAQLDTVYHQDITFADPVGEHRGMAAVKHYFSNLLETTEDCRFHIYSVTSSDAVCMVRWQMKLKHPRLNSGDEITLEGVSELKVKDDLVVYQRDFYDMGEMIYENVPLLRGVIGFIKNKMRAN